MHLEIMRYIEEKQEKWYYMSCFSWGAKEIVREWDGTGVRHLEVALASKSVKFSKEIISEAYAQKKLRHWADDITETLKENCHFDFT